MAVEWIGGGAEAALRRVWAALPPHVAGRAYPPARAAWAAARSVGELSRALAPSVLVALEGAALGGGSLHAVVIGSEQETRSFAARIFAGSPLVRRRAEIAPGEIARAARSAEADLVLASAPLLCSWRLGSLVRAPEAVEAIVPVAQTLARYARREGVLGRHRRAFERHGLRVSVRQGERDLARFREDFYLPYVRARFGAAVDPRPEGFVRGRAWELLVVEDGDAWIAGGLAVRAHDRYRFLDVGFLRGERAPLAKGAGHALYAAALRRAGELGYERLDLGPERPLLGDSGLRYKSSWGARLDPTPWATRALGVALARTDAALAFARASPLVVHGSSGALAALAPREEAVVRRARALGVFEVREP